MLDAKVKLDLGKHVSHGTLKFRILIVIQSKKMEPLETIFVETQQANKIQYGVTPLILQHHGKNVTQLVLLYLKMLMNLQKNLKKDNQVGEKETRGKTND